MRANERTDEQSVFLAVLDHSAVSRNGFSWLTRAKRGNEENPDGEWRVEIEQRETAVEAAKRKAIAQMTAWKMPLSLFGYSGKIGGSKLMITKPYQNGWEKSNGSFPYKICFCI